MAEAALDPDALGQLRGTAQWRRDSVAISGNGSQRTRPIPRDGPPILETFERAQNTGVNPPTAPRRPPFVPRIESFVHVGARLVSSRPRGVVLRSGDRWRQKWQ